MEDELLIRSRADLDILLVNIEAAARIKRRSDFFSWVQGVFQGLVKHEILICVISDPSTRTYRMDWMSGVPTDPETFAALCARGSGLVYRMMGRWEQSGRTPVCICVDGANSQRAEASMLEDLRRYDLNNAWGHGVPDAEGRAGGFFALARVAKGRFMNLEVALELMVPYLHASWARVCANEAQRSATPSISLREILTLREVEILNWVEQGKSNNEIAQILSISHLTVKNHVQKILRKLNVQNRAQAVAKGISLNLTGMR